jgi:enoyl-CoA hydratase
LRITLNRPRRLNALDDDAVEALHGALDQAEADQRCRVVHLRSTGRAFCSGFDMTEYSGNPDEHGGAEILVEKMTRLADIPLRMRRGRSIVIATVRGPAVGAGFALALGADIMLAGESAEFALPQTEIGVLATEMGLSFLLPRVIGLNRAANIMLRAANLDAVAAMTAGLVSEIWPDEQVDQAGLDLAVELAGRSANALRGTKQMLMAGLESGHLEATIQAETQAQVLSNYWPELRAAVARFRST